MGRGGERWGAGRPRQHGRTDAFPRIDARELHRSGALHDGITTWLTWRQQGEVIASAQLDAKANELVLHFTGGNDKRVPIARTPCRFGGTRPWFTCVYCGNRVAVLYLHGHWFKCRKCAHLVFPSQAQDAMTRAARKQSAIMSKLRGPDGEKPKGMHWRTFERVRAELAKCRETQNTELVRVAMRWGLFRHLKP